MIVRFFLFSLSSAILFACGLGGFLVWKSTQKEKAKITAIQEKRIRLENYYLSEFMAAYSLILDPSESLEIKKSGREWITETEANMQKDGYDRAEIENLRKQSKERVTEILNGNKILFN